jgi:hypothetical protein
MMLLTMELITSYALKCKMECWVFLKSSVTQWVKKFVPCIEPEGSVPSLQKPTIGCYPEPV